MACESRRAASTIELTRRHQQQSYSASVPTMRLETACVSRSRSRCSDTSYEQGKDRLANCLARWSYAEVNMQMLVFCNAIRHIFIDLQSA